MALFDFLSGSDEAQTAAAQNAAALQQYQQQLANAYGTYQTGALGALGQGRDLALQALQTGQAGQIGAQQQGLAALQGVSTAPLETGIAGVQAGVAGPLQQALAAQQAGLGAVQGGAGGAAAAGQAGVSAYDPLTALAQSYDPAVRAYMNSLGLGGPAGTAAAQAMFKTSPGYQFQVDEATKNALANASRLGIAGSGNTLASLGERLGNIALQDYGNWQTRLGGFVPQQLAAQQAASGGVANANQALAAILRAGGGDVAGAYGNVAGAYGNLYGGSKDLAALYAGLYGAQFGQAGALANAYGQIGQTYGTGGAQQAGLQTGYGQDVGNVYGNVAQGTSQGARDIAQGQIASNNLVAAQGAQDASNVWGLLGAGVKAGGAALGGYLGGPSFAALGAGYPQTSKAF
jgi:hypothetical protein